jgi:two-component system, OmpR family, phosphate regulon sensor histidine kinase PhoR
MVARIKPEKAELEQGAEAEALFMSIGEGAIVTDTNARISRVNQTALRILGFSEKEMLGKWFPEIIVAEDERGNRLSNIDRPMGQAFLTGKTVSARTYYRRKDGTRIPVFLTVSPVMLDSKPIGAIEVFHDISTEIALERAKDEFVAIASHQLRTPATAVKQYVGLLLEGYSDPLTDNQKLFLERAYESNERQLQIVQEILKVTKLDLEKVVLDFEKYDIRSIVSEAVSSTKSNFDSKQQKIIIKEPDEPLMAKVDSEQLRAAVENLLENASNYTWPGKAITVTNRRLKDRVRIVIKDEGVGIEAEDFPKLFQKFSRIPNPLSVEVSGTGLGLYWAAKIIHLHGGYIHVASSLGKGSIFTINLPDSL